MNGKRKFFLTLFSLVASTVLCWYVKMSGSEYVTVVSLVLAMYKVANVADKKLNGSAGNG